MGLSQTELSFFNILTAELGEEEDISEERAALLKSVTQSLVEIFEEATQIIDFFEKWDEQKRVRKNIKRIMIKNFDESAVASVTERFMELAKVKFK